MGKKGAMMGLLAFGALMLVVCIGLLTAIFIKQNNLIEKLEPDNSPGGNCSEELFNILPYRLSPNVVPRHYNLFLWADLDSNEFGGSISITIDIDATPGKLGQYIYLHAFPKLEIIPESSRLRNRETAEDVAIKSQCRHEPYEFWVLEVGSLPKGQYLLDLEFFGNMANNGLVGLYNASYLDAGSGETVHFAATQFESTNARKAFPCFDEPTFKSEFTVQIKHQSKYQALCNMDVSLGRLSVDSEWTVTGYKTSEVVMPTYLVAMTITDFDGDFAVNNGTRHGVWSREELAGSRAYALTAGIKVLDAYFNYTGFRFPLSKVDSIALPVFSPGAMENWGLVTYRETALLWTPGESTIDKKYPVAAVIAHELAHQWFGNRITMEFWGDLWLNEAFASWMEYKGTDAIEPEWDYEHEIMLADIRNGYAADCVANSQPIVRDVESPEAVAYQSGIVYQKGSSILNMLEGHLGYNELRTGLHHYLDTYGHKTAVTNNLWDSLQRFTDVDVAAVYDTWTRQPGFPFIEVTRDGGQVRLRQQRFLLDPSTATQMPQGYSYVWQIPVHFYEDGVERFELFNTTETTIPVSETATLKLNINHQGFYITKYDDWSLLGSQTGIFTPMDSAGLILDIHYLNQAKLVPYSEVVGLVGQILTSTNHVVPWRIGDQFVVYVDGWMKIRADTRQQFADLVISWLQAWYNSDMWSEENKSDQDVRRAVTILNLACRFGYAQCLADAKTQFDAWRQGTKITANLRNLVYNYGLKESENVDDLSFAWQQYEEATDSPIVFYKADLKTALSYVSEDALVQQYLDNIWDDTEVPKESFFSFLRNIAANPDAVEAAWTKFKDDFQNLATSFEVSDIGEMLVSFANKFADQAKYEEIAALVGDQEAYKTYLAESKAAIDGNIKWLEENAVAFVVSK